MFQLLPASAHRRHPSARMSMRIRGEELDFDDDQVFLYDGIPFTGAWVFESSVFGWAMK
jgi:hypothetical protein